MIIWADNPIAAVRCDLEIEEDEGVFKIHVIIADSITAIKSHRSSYIGDLLVICTPGFMSISIPERGPAQAR
jgi:hypothetical protein